MNKPFLLEKKINIIFINLINNQIFFPNFFLAYLEIFNWTNEQKLQSASPLPKKKFKIAFHFHNSKMLIHFTDSEKDRKNIFHPF